MTRYAVAADIGGTFTDFVVMEDSGLVTTGKLLTTLDDRAVAVLQGLRELVPSPDAIDFLVHGTTAGLNAFLERKGARVLLIMTAGVRDAYTIARGNRNDLYALQYRKPTLLVARHDVHEVRERMAWNGAVLDPLHEEDFAPIIEHVRRTGITAVAVCFLHAYAYPAHELRARAILAEALPGVSITLSHEIAREWREYERASSSVMNAYIAPIVERYLSSLAEKVDGLGVGATLHVMQSSGGVMTVDAARRQPVYTLLSGPVGGTVGCVALAAALGRPNLIGVDMGGTSFDVSLVVGGQPELTSETQLEGLPLLMSVVNIHTIGAGGGSLAWLEAGALRVGPQSAGSAPGPACYGRGGTQPTVTDANLFLKRLGAGSLLSGRMVLDEGAAAQAIHTMAAQLQLDNVAFAEGMLAITNAKMADAIRTITVQQGIDPREFSLVPFGGAGPMHAVWLARELNIGEVIVPRFPGNFSAWGMLQTDVRHDLTRTFYQPAAGVTPAALAAAFGELEREGAAVLSGEQVAEDAMYFVYSADMRYIGQEYTVAVAIALGAAISEIEQAFHAAHHTRYGHATPGAPVEFVNLRLAALGRLGRQPLSFAPAEPRQDPTRGQREAIFDGVAYATPVFWREWMAIGARFAGPLVIEEDGATTVVPPGYRVHVDELGNIIISAE